MTDLLVVWQEIPENTKCYKLSVSDTDLERFLPLAGKYINASIMTPEQEQTLQELSNLLTPDRAIMMYNEQQSDTTKAFSFNGVVLVAGFVL